MTIPRRGQQCVFVRLQSFFDIAPAFIGEFIKNNIAENEQEKKELDEIYNAWRFLSSCRYIKKNNTWTDFLKKEKQSIEIINNFISKKTTLSEYDKEKKDIEFYPELREKKE